MVYFMAYLAFVFMNVVCIMMTYDLFEKKNSEDAGAFFITWIGLGPISFVIFVYVLVTVAIYRMYQVLKWLLLSSFNFIKDILK